jgi:Homeodomain-like domain
LDKLGIPRATFYRWYDRYREGGPEALDDRRARPDRVWNRIPDNVRRRIIDLALDLPELSLRELAVRFADERKYFVSEASVYRLLKAHDRKRQGNSHIALLNEICDSSASFLAGELVMEISISAAMPDDRNCQVIERLE